MISLSHSLNINQAGYSDIGQIRKENEDFLINYHSPNCDFAFTVIADGMGGHRGGALASKLATTAVSNYLQTSLALVNGDGHISIFEQLKYHLTHGIQLANKHLLNYKQENPQLSEMGTTLVVAIIQGPHLIVANVGDSRAYLYSEQQLRQVSKDHSVVQELIDNGTLTLEAARSSNIRNQLTQAVGVVDELSIYFEEMFINGSGLILLCSDGLTEYLDQHSLETELSKGLPTSQSCHRLIEAANQRGGKDNITVAIIEYGGP